VLCIYIDEEYFCRKPSEKANVMHIFDGNGNKLDAECSVCEEDGIYGLILESWGPTHRNKDYNTALDCIIERLIDSGVDNVVVYLASSTVRKHMPSITERKIHPGEFFSLKGDNPRNIRLEMCSYQAHFSSTGKKDVPSGNRAKRIMINVPGINDGEFWEQIVLGELSDLFQPTEDEAVLNARVSKLIKQNLSEPKGYQSPVVVERLQKVFARDPRVKTWILQKSNGICESCGGNAPFYINGGIPYLEVHHVVPLSLSGTDTISNCVALCPNCHRALHYSQNAKELIEMLYNKIDRLQK
jgi:5-methylcytosine-specific restriction protein A